MAKNIFFARSRYVMMRNDFMDFYSYYFSKCKCLLFARSKNSTYHINLYQQPRVKCHHKVLTLKWLHYWAGKTHSTRLTLHAITDMLTPKEEMIYSHIHRLRRLFQLVKEMALGATFQNVQVGISLPNCTLLKFFANRLGSVCQEEMRRVQNELLT